MAKLVQRFSTADITPEVTRLDPARVISGDPVHTSWSHFDSDGIIYGIWESTPGKWHTSKDKHEYCHILSGRGIVTDAEGNEFSISAGDSFVLKPGFKGTWEALETMRKEYVVGE